MSNPSLRDLAGAVISRAKQLGATDSECIISEGDEFSVSVRMKEVENLKEAGSRGAGVRVLIGHRAGSAYTSDLSAAGLEKMVSSAIELAGITTEDPHAGLPEDDEFGSIDTDLQLYNDDVASLETPFKIEQAMKAETAALELDSRISNSEGASFDSNTGEHVFANSRGFLDSYRASRCSMSVIPVAKDGESMERDYWFTLSRSAAGLDEPANVGRIAAARSLRRLNARKVSTQKVPVIFEPRVARSMLGHIFEAVSGESVYRNASFLTGKIGERVASEKLTVIDDGTMPGLFGSSPFDDEGLPTRRTVVIDKGVLKSYLLNTYTARKLGLQSTGNASRGLTGNAGVGYGNLFAEAGSAAPEELIGGIDKGLYVTELIGFGVNVVTGDYSRGAVGLWIEKGEIAFPVAEVTIAGNLRGILNGIAAVGSDLEFRGSVACPTLLIDEMMVSGQ